MEEPDSGVRPDLQPPSSDGADPDAAICHAMSTASSSEQSQPVVDTASIRSCSISGHPPDPRSAGLGSAASLAAHGSYIPSLHSEADDSEAEEAFAQLADVLQTCLTARVQAQYRVTSQAVTRCAVGSCTATPQDNFLLCGSCHRAICACRIAQRRVCSVAAQATAARAAPRGYSARRCSNLLPGHRGQLCGRRVSHGLARWLSDRQWLAASRGRHSEGKPCTHSEPTDQAAHARDCLNLFLTKCAVDQVSSIRGSDVVDGLQVTLAGPSSAANTQHSQLQITFDNGDAAALDCLELVWQPSGPLSLLFTEVRLVGCLCLSRGCNCPRWFRGVDTRCVHRTQCEPTMQYFAHWCGLNEQRFSSETSGQCCTEQANQQVGWRALHSDGCILTQDLDLI